MNDLKNLTITGRLGDDPKTIKTEKSEFVALSIASSQSYKDANGQKVEKTVWTNHTANGKLADIIVKYFKKGNKVIIEAEPYNTKSKIGEGENEKIFTSIAFSIKTITNLSDNRTEQEKS